MGKKKDVFVDAFGEAPAKKQKEGCLKKLKIKIDEWFESENLTFLGKEMMLAIYGVVSSVGLIVLSSIGSAIIKLIWAFAKFENKCPSVFGAICGIGWLMFMTCGIAAIVLSVAEYCAIEENGESVLELKKEN